MRILILEKTKTNESGILQNVPWLICSNFASGSAGFKVQGSGDAEFNDVTVRGALIAQSGSSLSASYITTGSMSAARITTGTLSANRISGGTIGACTISADYLTAGTITARKYQTSSSGSRLVLNNAGWADMLTGYDGFDNRRLGIDSAGIIEAYAIEPIGGSYPTCTLMSGVIGRFSPSGATVYGPAAKNTNWENLNLSSIVGARRALVLLRVYNTSGVNKNYQFRVDGSGIEQGQHAEDFPGAFSCRCSVSEPYNYVWVMTGTNGYVEWRTTVIGITTLVLLAYIN